MHIEIIINNIVKTNQTSLRAIDRLCANSERDQGHQAYSTSRAKFRDDKKTIGCD